MKLLKAYRDGELLLDEVENANTFFTRLRGLMFRKSIKNNHALLLSPCNEIHTFFMKFDIDTVMLDKDNRIISIDRAIPPGKVRSRVKHCKKILEMNSGVSSELNLKVGEKLIFNKN